MLDENEKENLLREEIDKRVESVVFKLGIPRSAVYFLENYNQKRKQNT